MAAAERVDGVWYLPAKATEVHDVCGAGDAVLAGLAFALGRHRTLREAGSFAAAAAGQQVAQVGVSPVTIET